MSHQSGMSLIEVLVALFILALASAAIVMTLPRQPSRLDREIARLEETIQRLSDEAIASGEVRALTVGNNAYRAQAWRGARWVDLPRTLRTLPEPLTIRDVGGPDTERPWPVVVADTTGIVTARQIMLAEGTQRRVLTIDSSSTIMVER